MPKKTKNSDKKQDKAKEKTKKKRSFPKTKWVEKDFLVKCSIDSRIIDSIDINWDELAAIYEDHINKIDKLENIATYIAETLRRLPYVHSVKSRIKKPSHVIQKIIRKSIDDAERDISFSNYQTEVTDLIGLRVLHLYKEEWEPIHKSIIQEWDLLEEPTAYV